MSAHHPDAPHTTVSPVTPVQHRGETKSCCVLINIPALPGAPGCFNMGQSLHATCQIFPRVLGVAGSASANRFLSKDTFLVFEKQANIGENCIGYSIESFIVPLDPALHQQDDNIQNDGNYCEDNFRLLVSGHNSVTFSSWFLPVLSGVSESTGMCRANRPHSTSDACTSPRT